MKKRYELEYILNCSVKVLFPRLSTSEGLAEWFADEVHADGDIFTFVWNRSSSTAELTILKENRLVRFNWIDDDSGEDDYFEFRINTEELTGDIALIISDLAEEDEKDDAIYLWDTEVQRLKSTLGM